MKLILMIIQQMERKKNLFNEFLLILIIQIDF